MIYVIHMYNILKNRIIYPLPPIQNDYLCSMNRRYDQLGVSASKAEVHRAIKRLDKGLFPTAFCKILPDIVGGDPDFVNVIHADTAGTKPSLAYMYWRETGDMDVWHDIAQDAIVMNTDDLACVGCVDNIVLSSTIGRNKHLIPGKVIAAIIEGCQSFTLRMASSGIHLVSGGGETADVGDIVRTIDVGFTAFARMEKGKVLVNNILPGQAIVGLASYGQASYEPSVNSGIGSNGLTGAKHALLKSEYRTAYPETFAPESKQELLYSGKYALTDTYKSETSIGKLLLSPTRTYLPVIAEILKQHREKIHGIIHNTGGGLTKVLKYLTRPVKIIKDNLLPMSEIFQAIDSLQTWSRAEMYQVFNMGQRLELYCDPNAVNSLIQIAESFNIYAQVIGRVEQASQTMLVIRDEKGEYHYP